MHKFIAFIAGIAFSFVPEIALMQGVDPCPLGELACPGADAAGYFASILVGGAKVAFGGVLFASMIWYGFKLMMGADNDSTVTEVYNSYAYAMVGTILAGGAFFFANTFALPGVVVNQEPTATIIFSIIATLRALLFIALVFNIFYQGARLVMSQDEGQTDKAKKQFIYGIVGAVIVILADRIVFAVAGNNIGIIAVESVGIANFMGTILGAFAVIALFVAGLWLVLAVDEQNKDKAKKIIIGALVVLAVTMASLALIRLTAFAPL